MESEVNNINIDLESICTDLCITKEIYIRIITKAFDQTDDDIQSISNALANNDFETISAATHRLKGDYNNMRLSELALIAKKIEEISKNNKNIEEIGLLLEEFKVLYNKIKNFISSIDLTT